MERDYFIPGLMESIMSQKNGDSVMAFSLSIGESDFADLRKNGGYYVDKTELIYKLAEQTRDKVSLFTRPRRFGKTLMMSMIANFFDNRKDSRELFTGLSIMEHAEFCRKRMNQSPVIFISFKDVEGLNFDGAYKMLQSVIAELCMRMPDLPENAGAPSEQREVYSRLKSKNADIAEVKNALKTVMEMLYSLYGEKVILLIDEYDVPLAQAAEKDNGRNRFYEQMLDVIRGIMSTALKDNEYLDFAVITGCLRMTKESIFTGTNNFTSYSVLDADFSDSFGFTDQEVEELLAAAKLSQAAGVIKDWYDGYVFGDSRIYCPWDVTRYVSDLLRRPEATPKNYWKNTSHNGILMTFAREKKFPVKSKFEILMNGGVLEQTISDDLTYHTLTTREDNFWSTLLMTGYVTKSDPGEEGEKVHIRIPNREVESVFEDTVIALFEETIDASEQRAMMEAFWNGDEVHASEAVSSLLWKTVSYNDYHEDYYHAFLTGIFVGLGYEVASNREMGLGRADIVLKDEKNRRALILEAKISTDRSHMERDCRKALEQIVNRKYALDDSLYGYRQILCYGIAFYKKEAEVMKLDTGDV